MDDACFGDVTQHRLSKGNPIRRALSSLLLLPAWFAPHKSLRGLCHRLRGVRIGKRVEIGYFVVIDNVHPSAVIIEDDAVLTAGVTVLAHDNAYHYTYGLPVRFAETRIGRHAFVGIGAVILPGVTIGDRAIVGANSVVTKSVEPRVVVAGLPAKEIRRFEENPR